MDPFPQIISYLGKKISLFPLVGRANLHISEQKTTSITPRSRRPLSAGIAEQKGTHGCCPGFSTSPAAPGGWENRQRERDGAVPRWQRVPSIPKPPGIPSLAPGQFPSRAVHSACPVSSPNPFISPLSCLNSPVPLSKDLPGRAGGSCTPRTTRKKWLGSLSGLEKASRSRSSRGEGG